MTMAYEVAEKGEERTLVVLRGRLDTQGVAMIETGLTAAIVPRRRNAVLDLSETEFITSLGIRALVSIAKALHGSGKRLVISGPPPLVAEALAHALGGQLIPIVDDLAAADLLLAA